MQRRTMIALGMVACMVSTGVGQATPQSEYARVLLDAGGQKGVELKAVEGLGHPEAFRVVRKGERVVIEAGSPAGWLYGAQATVRGEAQAGQVEKPAFDIRGTTLWIAGAVSGGRIAAYDAQFNAERFPWFFERAFMTRYLDALADARFNTLFLWASHPFPDILELPEYPGVTDLTAEQLKQNQDQFHWLAQQCQRRNIRVLLHFYNIHLPNKRASRFKAQRGGFGASAVSRPTPEVARYYKYVLGRYFEEFPGVGLYICPGETLASSHQLEWFRDVIFAAAKASGKNPLLVIRDWTMNNDFRSQIRELYENCYSELKHNDESFTSPVPDRRHESWRGVLTGHIVNLHGPPMDLQPMRWASPVLIRETAGQWRKLRFVKGAEIFALSCFDWPHTQDKLAPDQFGYREQVKGPKLLWLDRSQIYLDAFGRYLWKVDRDEQAEREHWEEYLAEKFHSPQVGKALYQWYVLTGPISPGMQNLTAVKFGNFWATVMLQNQGVDLILNARKRIDDVPITLTREAGRTRQIYYSQPVDSYFFERYKAKYRLPGLTQRLSMPVTQYAGEVSAGREVTEAMTPDRVCDLLCDLATEGLEAAREAHAAASDRASKEELARFVSDSEMYVLSAEALRHKVRAAILKARMLNGGNAADLAESFRKHMEQSVAVYEKLAELTDRTYRNANDLMGRHWKREGLREFRKDLTVQKAWLAAFVAKGSDWPFFALCMDTHDAKRRTLAQQAEMLKDLGYSGAGHLWLGKVAERIETLDAAGLKLWHIYVRLNVAPDAKQPYDPKLKEILPLLKGRPTTLCVLVSGGKPSDQAGDARAVELIREMADLARPFGVKLALYPHVRDWLEKVSDAVRVADKVDRPNAGVMFNLCHFLKTDNEKDIRSELTKAGSRLLAVSINGSPTGAEVRAGKGKWIAPLDEGAFDMAGLLKTLQAVGYKGPVGLQCYGIRGDAREHLARSMAAWRKLRQAATE